MDEINKEVIAIDKEAAEKLEEANRMKDEVLKKQLQEENQELKKKIHDRAQMHLDSVRSIEQKHAVEAIAQIDADKDKALAVLQKVYEQNHQVWEDDLYNRVLGR